MDKQTLLDSITEMTNKDELNLKELLNAYHAGKPKTQLNKNPISQIFASIFYYLGALIIYAGISVLIWQHWQELSFIVKISVTLGVSIAAYFTAVFLHLDKRVQSIANGFFLIAFLSYPIGLYTLFAHLGYDVNSLGFASFTALTGFIISVISFLIYRKNIFIVYNIIFGTFFVYAYTNYLIQDNPYFVEINFFSYRNLLLGIVYLLLGYHFTLKNKKVWSTILYSIGVIAVLGSILDLSGWQPNQHLIWEIIMPIACFLFIFLSVPSRSKSLLIIATLFLMIFIGKITSEYFVGSLGWPLALVIAGLLIIITGYFSLKFHGKFHREHAL